MPPNLIDEAVLPYRKLADVASQGVEATGGPTTPAGARLRDMESFFDYLDTEVPGVANAGSAAHRRGPGR